MQVILTCSCKGQDKFVREAYSILYPDTPVPPIYKGRGSITQLADKYPDTNLSKYLKGIASNKEKYAYLLTTDGRDVLSLINLKTGAKIC